MLDDLIPLFAIFFVFGAPVLGFIVVRVLQHRERMEMIRLGIAPTVATRDWKSVRQVNPPPAAAPQYDPSCDDDPRRILRKGITLTFIGFAILMGLSFIGIHDDGMGWRFQPGPWLLGGLIPMFIGISQVIIAVLSGAVIGGPRYVNGPPPNIYGVPSPPPSAGAPPNYSGSYTYRPGATQELRKPNDVERS
jgi:hypothetical protein